MAGNGHAINEQEAARSFFLERRRRKDTEEKLANSFGSFIIDRYTYIVCSSPASVIRMKWAVENVFAFAKQECGTRVLRCMQKIGRPGWGRENHFPRHRPPLAIDLAVLFV